MIIFRGSGHFWYLSHAIATEGSKEDSTYMKTVHIVVHASCASREGTGGLDPTGKTQVAIGFLGVKSLLLLILFVNNLGV